MAPSSRSRSLCCYVFTSSVEESPGNMAEAEDQEAEQMRVYWQVGLDRRYLVSAQRVCKRTPLEPPLPHSSFKACSPTSEHSRPIAFTTCSSSRRRTTKRENNWRRSWRHSSGRGWSISETARGDWSNELPRVCTMSVYVLHSLACIVSPPAWLSFALASASRFFLASRA